MNEVNISLERTENAPIIGSAGETAKLRQIAKHTFAITWEDGPPPFTFYSLILGEYIREKEPEIIRTVFLREENPADENASPSNRIRLDLKDGSSLSLDERGRLRECHAYLPKNYYIGIYSPVTRWNLPPREFHRFMLLTEKMCLALEDLTEEIAPVDLIDTLWREYVLNLMDQIPHTTEMEYTGEFMRYRMARMKGEMICFDVPAKHSTSTGSTL